MVASLVSVALALVGASRTLDESYYCNMVPPVWEMAGADGLQVRARLEESYMYETYMPNSAGVALNNSEFTRYGAVSTNQWNSIEFHRLNI